MSAIKTIQKYITVPSLRVVAPTGAPRILDSLSSQAKLFCEHGITTPTRLAYFLGQVCAETGGLRSLEESLNYTSVSRIRSTWPSRFPTDESARPYVSNPQLLANKVYGGRMGNDTVNDGWTYRGSGLLQNTGRSNYNLVQAETGIPCVTQPELLRTMPNALISALVFWRNNNCNHFADLNDIKGLTQRINGGQNGIEDRKLYTERALKLIRGNTSVTDPLPPSNYKPAPDNTVKQAQEHLVKHGFTLVADGVLGAKTAAALKDFQNLAKIPVTGKIDAATIAKLILDPKALSRPRNLFSFLFSILISIFGGKK